jgi:hypothetical protein
MRTELIVATYENPRSLRLSLASVARQRLLPDGVAIADDGSGPETRAVIEAFAAANPGLAVRHVWHEDAGFRKAAILNRAIASSGAEFLVFIDGDVMIHPGFVARHVALARPDRWASGSLIRLDAAATAAVTEADVASGRVFERDWLRAHGAFDRIGTWLKAMPFPMPVMAFLDRVSPVQRAWCGANASAFREALLRVNGFDETMRWGGGRTPGCGAGTCASPRRSSISTTRGATPIRRTRRPTRRGSGRSAGRAWPGPRTGSPRRPRPDARSHVGTGAIHMIFNDNPERLNPAAGRSAGRPRR